MLKGAMETVTFPRDAPPVGGQVGSDGDQVGTGHASTEDVEMAQAPSEMPQATSQDEAPVQTEAGEGSAVPLNPLPAQGSSKNARKTDQRTTAWQKTHDQRAQEGEGCSGPDSH